MPSNSPHINIFIAYTTEDGNSLDKLLKHLKSIERFYQAHIWHEGKLKPGQDKLKVVEDEIGKAHIILLLVSSDFLASDHCFDEQLKRAIERHEQKTSRVIPIIVGECDWRWEKIPFHNLKPLPNDGIPITDEYWGKIDKPCKEIAQALRNQIEELQTQISLPSNPLQKQKSTKSTRKKGQVIYRIPSKMKKEEASICTIRIAPKDLPEEIQKEFSEGLEDAKIEGIRRIDKLMKVELLDDSNGLAFDISLRGNVEQAIVEDDYTEWKYEVTPLLEGRHLLVLQVSITVLQEHGKEYQNAIVLNREIQVVTEDVTEKAIWQTPPSKAVPMLVVHSHTADEDKEPPPATQAKIRALPFLRKYSKALAMFLLFVFFLPTAAWAAAPELMVEPYLNIAYEEHKKLEDGRIAVKDKTGKWGMVNAHGIQSTKPEYDEIQKDASGIIQVKKGDKWGALQAEDISDKKGISKIWNNIIAPDDVKVVPTISEKPPIKIKGTNQVQVQINGRLDTLPKIPPKKIKQDAPKQLEKAIQKLPVREREALQEVQDLLEQNDVESIQRAEIKLATLDKISAKKS